LRIPLATYRLQFGRGFGFREAAAVVPYLSQLGISDLYASPIFAAHSDNASGYDIVDPTRLNSNLGSRDDFNYFCAELRQHGMGLILDIVPNHMAAHTSNRWWKDVLENGASSPYAYYFDIEWDPPSRAGSTKINWPILGGPYGEVLERQELSLGYSEEGFAVHYFDRALPIDPATYGGIFAHLDRCKQVDDPLPSLTALIRSLVLSASTWKKNRSSMPPTRWFSNSSTTAR
jgi:(1->4)-alpha-D-glucan 1-alpha-D-glucosylmutase